ncbi:DUF2254 domain-containing protein [Halomonas chromatireducens]|uniref:DUF2254 domain-containing protein n=1 Tax=Halomonas chromatireducens TaxID=507626 RepID=A0A109UL10_9GAMM|nr:DUF2254 domain-containing protein [Halomonas chromatireducens]AMC99796.1 hypothetical protein LOKO_00715 [Halomonas chromatireducens]
MITAFYNPIKMVKAYRQSIAYIPSLLALGYFLLGLAAVVPEEGLIPLPVTLEFLHFTDTETRRTLLSALLTGMVSLMVFSFSMVMSVLSQAGGNFSHKLVFGLVTKRHHQWVLGHYLGTILYVLMLLMMPGSDDSPGLWRSLHAYLGAVMVIHCLALFVYFIHKASQSVQVNSVAASLHQATSHSLSRMKARQQAARFEHFSQVKPVTTTHFFIASDQTGTIQRADFEKLAELAANKEAILYFNVSLGDFVLKGYPLLSVEAADAPDEEWTQEILAQVVLGQAESIEDSHVHGLTQLMEIAIKALSPGVNDPGTALLCINQLADLLRQRLDFSPCNALVDGQGKLRVTWPTEDFHNLLYRIITPILRYGHKDLSIGLSLLEALKTLSLFAGSAQRESLQQQADRVFEMLNQTAQHHLDRDFINRELHRGEHRLILPDSLPATFRRDEE